MAVTTVPGRNGTAVIAAGDENGVILRWDPKTGDRIGDPITGSRARIMQITSLILSTGSTLLIATDSDSTLWRWDASTGEWVGEPISLGSEYPTVAPAVVEGAARLFTSGTDNIVREWDTATGELIGFRGLESTSKYSRVPTAAHCSPPGHPRATSACTSESSRSGDALWHVYTKSYALLQHALGKPSFPGRVGASWYSSSSAAGVPGLPHPATT
ncbi:hypothetical protein ACWEQ2_02620 [Streptomyces sp. NPDC004096]